MHPASKEWDKKWSTSSKQNKRYLIAGVGEYIPLNRPCDYCGEITDEGFIHAECLLKENPQIAKIIES